MSYQTFKRVKYGSLEGYMCNETSQHGAQMNTHNMDDKLKAALNFVLQKCLSLYPVSPAMTRSSRATQNQWTWC